VFKTNSVQAAGGAMIFRPSYKGQLNCTEGKLIIILEDNPTIVENNTVEVINNKEKKSYVGTVKKVEGGLEFIGNDTITESIPSITVIDYGSDNNQDLLIGINSGGSEVGYNKKILPRGLTLTNLANNSKEPKLFLGDLT
jgi:hypothetical protein